MSKYQKFRDVIESSKQGGSDAPILYSTTGVDEKNFKALIGRKIKMRPLSAGVAVCLLIIIAVSAILVVLGGNSGTPVFAAYIPIFVILITNRTTLIAVGEESLDFYCIDSKRGSYFSFDSFSLPFDRITNVKMKSGRFNTSFAFEFLNDDKKYKIRTTVPNKIKNTSEQAENLKYLTLMLTDHRIRGDNHAGQP